MTKPHLPSDGHRDGATYNPTLDCQRLNIQHRAVLRVMMDGEFHTLANIERMTGHPQASISARLRDFRKPRYGGHTVERQRLASGIYQYRLVVNRPTRPTDRRQ